MKNKTNKFKCRSYIVIGTYIVAEIVVPTLPVQLVGKMRTFQLKFKRQSCK